MILLGQLLLFAVAMFDSPSASIDQQAARNEFEQAKEFLNDIQELTFYGTSWEGKDTVVDPDSEIKHTLPNGNVTYERKTVSFEEVRNRLVSFAWSPQEVKDVFSHGTYKRKPFGLMWKGAFPGVAKMRDGSEKILHISMYGGFYTVEGMNLLFGFDEIGRKKWDAIDQRYREFLSAKDKVEENGKKASGRSTDE